VDYKGKCLKEISTYLRYQEVDEKTLDFMLYVFEVGFDYGSLNGASDNIQELVIKDINMDFKSKIRRLLD